MENIIALRIRDKEKGEAAFLTWGRIFGNVDATQLCTILLKHLPAFNIHHPESIELCYSLNEVSHFPYFYEGKILFSQRIVVEKFLHDEWYAEKKKLLKKGNEIYFLGFASMNIDQGFWDVINPKDGTQVFVTPDGYIHHGFIGDAQTTRKKNHG